MVYQGSKAKLRKYILPILQNCINENHIENYYEPFCGGANMIDHIRCKNRIGSDINSELIELLKYMRDNPNLDIFPQDCSFEHYSDVRENRKNKTNKYSTPYTSGIGYFASFGGRYFQGGYGRNAKGGKCIYNERLRNAKEQASLLKGIEFNTCSFENYNPNYFNQCLFYLDPPYRDTKNYNGKDEFPYDFFYDWCEELGKENYVFISEYYMPPNFQCIWSKERMVLQKSDREKGDVVIEKLFTIGKSKVKELNAEVRNGR